MELENIKKEISDPAINEQIIVQKYLVYGNAFIFENDSDKYFSLKRKIADHFKIGPELVFMVGSGKLGFSIAPNKIWRKFGDDSDIDMVIVSEKIFDEFWKELYNFNIELTSRTQDEDKKFNSFLKYFFKGWIRPDLFPFNFERKTTWENFFKSISYKEFGGIKITGALYRNMFFFENYHINNIKKLRNGE